MATKKLLTKQQLEKLLKGHPSWTVNKSGTKLTTTITFETHAEALAFLVRLTIQAEVLEHHPDVLFTYKKLKVDTATHDVSGLTKLDHELVERVDELRVKVGDK